MSKLFFFILSLTICSNLQAGYFSDKAYEIQDELNETEHELKKSNDPNEKIALSAIIEVLQRNLTEERYGNLPKLLDYVGDKDLNSFTDKELDHLYRKEHLENLEELNILLSIHNYSFTKYGYGENVDFAIPLCEGSKLLHKSLKNNSHLEQELDNITSQGFYHKLIETSGRFVLDNFEICRIAKPYK